MRPITLSVFILCAAGAPVATAQALLAEDGRPFHVERFSPSDYGHNEQNWGITQDDRGVIFVANRIGVLEYDGQSWRSHGSPNRFARSIAATASERICIGGVGEIGCLQPDESGRLVYHSILDDVPEDDRDFADVWTTISLPEGVYFQSFKSVIRWDGRTVRTWRATGRFHKAFAAHGRYFVRDEGVGLLTLEGDSLVLVDGGEQFASERIDALMPLGREASLVVTRERGMLLWKDGEFRRFQTDVNEYVRGKRLYHGAAISDSTVAITTFSGSVLVLDASGRLVARLAENVGLQPDELVLDVFPDRQGGLWLALDSGILRVDAPTPLTQYDASLGLEGVVYEAYRYDGHLYVGTSQGLFRLVRPSAGAPVEARQANFVRLDEISQQVWFTLKTVDRLLVATNDGVYSVSGMGTSRIVDEAAFTLVESRLEPGVVFVGLKRGLGRLERGPRGWSFDILAHGDDVGEIRGIVDQGDGTLWLTSAPHGLVRVEMDGGEVSNITRGDGAHGSSMALRPVLELADGVLAVLDRDGVYRIIDQKTMELERDTRFDAVIDFDDEGGYLMNVVQTGSIWIINRGRVREYTLAGDRLIDVTPAVLHVRGLPQRMLMIEDNGVVWIGAEDGLLRYDPRVRKDYSHTYRALVRAVMGKGHQSLFGGSATARSASLDVRYEDNNLRFEVAAATFNNSAATEFRFWLEGFDDGWSEWGHELFKEYTNLPEGRYRFHVRARNAQGVVGEVDTFGFSVLPPWYRTWWAYLSYVLAGGLIIWGYGRWRMREHLIEIERERRVRADLEVANARLKEANERLHEADKLKDDVLANVSHELRTPLTSILGFATILSEELRGETRGFAHHIHESGKRLLRTVDTLLDMARLQADTMEIDPEDIDVAAAVAEIARGLEPAARAKNLYLTVLPENFHLPSRTDPAALDRILTNLIGNAIKFTESGGVTVLVDGDDDHVFVTVRDTGIGIREEFLPHLFGEFKQASAGYGRSHEGTGLGLAVTHRLVQLLDGEIRADARDGGGTAFTVRLPRRLERETRRNTVSLQALHLRDRKLLLIVDPSRQEYALRSALSSLADVQVAAGLDEGARRLRENRFDVVLVNGYLEGLHDGRTLGSLRSEPGADTAAFVAVTAATMPGDRERFKEMGFDEHVGKPFSRSRLLTTLEALIHRPIVA